MNRLQMNEIGLAESLASVLSQISALASVAHFTATSTSNSVYSQELAQLLITTKKLAEEAEIYRAEWAGITPRYQDVRGLK
ncbi:hypothetical protein RAS56_004700 [Salmonella enterica]|uniref:hypothetical protein n=1 Tax=Salmonella enterica TaxID=28901 RepID=UPI0009AF04C6|nr:hypothetical protein [Salmonella enterica]EAB8969562.1 hypothetical protein [Salmonella enterica subsp. enterica serovar Kottbus]EDM6777748.1 hypothetical protein [Salmonella enterica subsp. enterica serovar Newport]EIC2638192.1 hypothetical protein [Salmonella enterica subsp. enterica serovar Indiana]EKO1075253.1 hypothetical protein [Salmonella enterica subsp. enterica]EBP1818978.1 hypothetical protein [Salmonella enterica]